MTGKSLGSRLAWACLTCLFALGFCVVLRSLVICAGGAGGKTWYK